MVKGSNKIGIVIFEWPKKYKLEDIRLKYIRALQITIRGLFVHFHPEELLFINFSASFDFNALLIILIVFNTVSILTRL